MPLVDLVLLHTRAQSSSTITSAATLLALTLHMHSHILTYYSLRNHLPVHS